MVDSSSEKPQSELARRFLGIVSKALLSYGHVECGVSDVVYSLFCIQDVNDRSIALIQTNWNG